MVFTQHNNLTREKRYNEHTTFDRSLLLYCESDHISDCNKEFNGDCYFSKENDWSVSIYNCHGEPEPGTLLIACTNKNIYDIRKYYSRGDFVKHYVDSIDHYLCIVDENIKIKEASLANTDYWLHFQTSETLRRV